MTWTAAFRRLLEAAANALTRNRAAAAGVRLDTDQDRAVGAPAGASSSARENGSRPALEAVLDSRESSAPHGAGPRRTGPVPELRHDAAIREARNEGLRIAAHYVRESLLSPEETARRIELLQQDPPTLEDIEWARREMAGLNG